jgi:P pilus assembly chaperone PapD
VIAVPPAALTVSPTRVVVAAGERRTLEITNHGATPATVAVSTAGYAVGLRGTPRIVRGTRLVLVRPQRVTLRPGATAAVVVSPAAAPPQRRDRPALVLVASRPARGAVGVSLRIGVLVLVRGAGPIVHRVEPIALRVRRRVLELVVRNAGTVSERLSAANVAVRLGPRGRAQVEPRELLPRSRGIVRLRIRAPATVVRAVVHILGRT